MKRFGGPRAIEREALSKVLKVEEVLDATVPGPEDDDRFQFFGNDRLGRVHQYFRSMKIEEGWVGTPLWFGPDGISYSDIDLEPDARLSAPGHEREPRTDVFVLGPNRFNFDGRRIEGQAVRLELGLADGLDIRTDRFVRALSSPEKIKVARRAIGLVRPSSKEHCALENEAITNVRLSEAVQEPLGDEGQEQKLMVLARGARATEKPGLDGSREMGRRLSIHGMESRYGCMTR